MRFLIMRSCCQKDNQLCQVARLEKSYYTLSQTIIEISLEFLNSGNITVFCTVLADGSSLLVAKNGIPVGFSFP